MITEILQSDILALPNPPCNASALHARLPAAIFRAHRHVLHFIRDLQMIYDSQFIIQEAAASGKVLFI